MIWKTILYFHLMITKIKSLNCIHQIVLIVANYASTLSSKKRKKKKCNKPQGKGLHCCVWVKTKGRARRKSLKSLCCLGVFSLIAWLSKYVLYSTTFWGINPNTIKANELDIQGQRQKKILLEILGNRINQNHFLVNTKILAIHWLLTHSKFGSQISDFVLFVVWLPSTTFYYLPPIRRFQVLLSLRGWLAMLVTYEVVCIFTFVCI